MSAITTPEGSWDFDAGDLTVYAFDDHGGIIPIFTPHEDAAGMMSRPEMTANATAAALIPDMLRLLREIAARDDRPRYLPEVQTVLDKIDFGKPPPALGPGFGQFGTGGRG